MTYDTARQLPRGVKSSLPPHAQQIYKETFNSACRQHSSRHAVEREEVAHRIAWGAVKKVYERDGSGRWRRKQS